MHPEPVLGDCPYLSFYNLSAYLGNFQYALTGVSFELYVQRFEEPEGVVLVWSRIAEEGNDGRFRPEEECGQARGCGRCAAEEIDKDSFMFLNVLIDGDDDNLFFRSEWRICLAAGCL